MTDYLRKVTDSRRLSLLVLLMFFAAPILYNVFFVEDAIHGMFVWTLWIATDTIILTYSATWMTYGLLVFAHMGLKNVAVFLIFGEVINESPMSFIINASIFAVVAYYVIRNAYLEQRFLLSESQRSSTQYHSTDS